MKKIQLTNLKVFRLLALLLCLAATVPQLWAQTYTVAGSDTQALGDSWSPTTTSNDMTLYSGNWYYLLKTVTYSSDNTYQYKITVNHSWNTSYGNNGGGDNASYAVKSGTGYVCYAFNSSTHVPHVVQSLQTVVIAGDDTQALGSSTWNGSNTANSMTTTDGITYTLTRSVTYTEGGSKLCKAVVAGNDWYGNSSGGNVSYNIPGSGSYTVTYTFNAVTGIVSVNVQSDAPVTPDYYITGDAGLGLSGWSYNQFTTMTYDANNDIYTYSYNVTSAGTYYFAFADGAGSDWNDFNGNHRYGPSSGNEDVNLGSWAPTQKGGGSYAVTVDAGPVTITFDVANMRYKVEGTALVIIPDYYVVGDNFPNGWNTGASTLMTDNNDGTYSWTSGQMHLDAGTNYEYKVLDSNGTYHPSGANATFNVAAPGTYTVAVTYDSNNGTVNAVPTLVQADPTYNYTFYVLPDDGSTTPTLYLWGTNNNSYHPNGDWPGTAMGTTEQLADGNNWYKYTGALYANLMNAIVNNGNNGHQTADITDLAPDTYYIYWNVNSDTYTKTTTAPVPAPTYDYTIYVRYKGDDTPYMYMWDGNNTELLGAFPGTDLTTFTSEQINGYTYYKYVVNGSNYPSLNMILDEGNSGQTQNLAVAPGTSYFTYGGGNTVSGPNAAADPAIIYYTESDFGGWTTTDTQMSANGDGSYSKTFTGVTLNKGTEYGYKVYGNDGTSEGVWIGDSNGDNATLTPDMSGTYTVTITLNSDGTLSHTLTITAAGTVYITGNGVLGGFSCDNGIAMTYTSNGIYTYATTLSDKATTQFIFADGQDADWSTFNSTYRIGPDNGDETYTVNSGYTSTQKAGGDNGSYSVVAGAGTLTFYFDAINMEFKVEGTVPAVIYYVVGNDANLFGAVWEENEASKMTYDETSGTYTWSLSNISLTRGGEYKFKVKGDDGSWRPADDIVLNVEHNGTYNLTVTFDGTNVDYVLTLVEAENQGTFYIEGSEGLGLTWSYAPEQTMTFDATTGLYSYTANVEESGTYNFVFANGQGTGWDDFNNNYRIGPQSGGQIVELDGYWVSTQMAGGDNGAYSVTLGAGTVTIYFDAENMRFMVDGGVPTYDYTFYVLPVNTTAAPHLYLWDENGNTLNGEWAGNEMTETATLADDNNWYVWNGTLLVNLVNAIVSSGSNADQTQNITNLTPNTYYIKWDASNKSYTISTVPPAAEGDPLFIHGTYYYDQTQHTYLPNDGTQMKYDGANQLYYLNNVTLNDQNTFCFTTGNGETWELAGTRYGNGGPDYYDMGDDGTNYLSVTPTRINTQMPLGEWDETFGEYRMATSGVYNMMVSLVEGNQYVKLIRTDSISLSPMNVYLEQTDNVKIDNIQDAGTTYSNAMFDNGYWPLSAYDRVHGGSDHWSTSNQYSVTHLADTITPDGKKWWHWQVTASICELFFTRTNKSPYQSTTFDRKAGILWVTWDENVINGDTITTMTDHSREYFESSATELPSNATVVEGHYYVYFINNVGWETVYCNAWNVNGSGQYTDGYGRNVQTWPGQPCECIGIDPVTGYEVWRYDFGPINETTPPTGLLFNDGNTYSETQAKEQTGDFVFQNGAVYDYLGQFVGAYTLNNLIRTAVLDERYTISDDLIGVYYDRDAKTEISYINASGTEVTEVITGALYAKDLNLYGERSIQPDQSCTDYVYDICASAHTAGGSQIMDKKTDYDQSNWVKLVISPLYDGGGNLPVDKSERPNLEEYVNHIIPGGQMVVYMDNRINPTAHVTKIVKGATHTYEPNVYVSAHFNDSIVFAYTHNEWQPKKPDGTSYEGVYRTVPRYVYDGEGNIVGITREVDYSQLYKMFYVAPKPQEVAYLTWIVYDNPNTLVGNIRPYGDYNSGEYLPQTHAASVLPNEPGEFYAPMNWHRGVAFVGDSLNYLSEEGFGVEYGPYSNGYMQYGGVKVNWSLFGDSIGNQAHVVESDGKAIHWWQIFEPGQVYKIKAIIRYAHDSNGNTQYLPGNGDIPDEDDAAYDERTHVMNAPRRSNGQGDYANMFFTPYDDLDESKFIIFPIEAYPSESNGDGMGNVTTVQEVNVKRTVVSTRYYNLMGISSDKPFDGINIIVTTYSDGSRTSKKVLR